MTKCQKKIIVMGGTFCPPTVAHLKLMESAVEAMKAEKGFFVPTASEYVVKKMKYQQGMFFILGESTRLEMLKSMCGDDRRLAVSDIQFLRAPQKDDYGMLLAFKEKYPKYEILFILGSDKLHVLSKWHAIDSLLRDFRFLVARRAEDDVEKILSENAYLASHRNRFEIFDLPGDIASISSSVFRRRLQNHDASASDFVTREVWKILKDHGAIPWEAITDFHEVDNAYLSNFHEVSVTYEGLTFGSNEAAFQAQKCMSFEEKARFTEYSPGKSKKIGRHVQLRPDWESVKCDLMTNIVRAKFLQHSDLAQRLLATGTKTLVEGNKWGDTYWGVDIRTGEGENHLGRILMKVREELKNNGR